MDKNRDIQQDIGYLRKLPYQISNEIEKKFEELKLTFSTYIAKLISRTIHNEFAVIINDIKKQNNTSENGAKMFSLQQQIDKLQEELEIEKAARKETLKRAEKLVQVISSYKQIVDDQSQKIVELMGNSEKESDARTIEVVFGNNASKFQDDQAETYEELQNQNEILLEKVMDLEDKLKIMSTDQPEKLKYLESEYEKISDSCKIFERSYADLHKKFENMSEAYEELLKEKDSMMHNKGTKLLGAVNEKTLQSLTDKLNHRDSEIADMKVQIESYCTRMAELEQNNAYLEDIFEKTYK